MFKFQKKKCTDEVMGKIIKKKEEWKCMVFNCRIHCRRQSI